MLTRYECFNSGYGAIKKTPKKKKQEEAKFLFNPIPKKKKGIEPDSPHSLS
jgi:hypothetical protein